MERIKGLLKTHPRGLSITNLASITGLNRNLIAKYLDMLVISGQVEVQQYGPAKVFFPSQRIPVTAMIEISSDLVMVLDQDRKIAHVNRPFAGFLGIPRDELLGKAIGEVGHPFLGAIPLPPADLPLDPRDGGIIEVRHTDASGERHFRVKKAPAVFEDGSVGLTLIIEDITDRRRYEEVLRLSEARYRGIVEDQTDFITRYLADTTITFVNQAGARALGCSPEEFAGKRFIDVIPVEERAGVMAAIGSLSRENPAVSLEHRIRTDRGDLRWQHWTNRAIFNEDGTIREYQGMGRDVTDMKAAEEKLKESESLQKAILSASPVGIGLITDHHLIWANDSMYALQGIRPGELKGQHERVAFAEPAEYERVSREIYGGVERHGVGETETVIRRKDGTLLDVSLRAAPIRSGSPDIIVVATDITARKQAERALRESGETFRTMVDISPLPLSLVDASGKYLYINPAFTEVFGYTLADIPDGMAWFERAFPDDGARKTAIRLWKEDAMAHPAGEVRPRTFPVQCKDGSRKDILFLPAATPGGLQVVVYQDLTRDAMTGRLRETEDRYRHLVDDLDIGIYRSSGDPAGRFIWGNTGLISILGYESLADLQGVPVRDLFAKPDGRGDLLRELREKKFVKNRILSLKRRDGAMLTVSVTALAEFDEKGEVRFITGLVQEIGAAGKAP
ncbi:MAG TPA: PAS domain S-box protein [Methanomicrobiales archaeon]|nr:PAS domain S-box protein [Methanomicrobiales archaeon]